MFNAVFYFQEDKHIFTPNISKQLSEESTRKNTNHHEVPRILLITDGASVNHTVISNSVFYIPQPYSLGSVRAGTIFICISTVFSAPIKMLETQ